MPYGPEALLSMADWNGDPFSAPEIPYPVPSFRMPGSSPSQSAMLQLLLEPIIRGMLPQGVYAPGQVLSQQNLVSQMHTRRDLHELESALRVGSELDRVRWFDTMRGIAGVTPGAQFNPAAAWQLTGDARPGMQMLGRMAPEAYSFMHGGRDAFTFSRELFLAGRTMPDPVTGMPRLSPLSQQALTGALYNDFYGPNADPTASRGLTSYQLGGILSQMQTAGLGPGQSGLGRGQAQAAQLAGGLGGVGGIGGIGGDMGNLLNTMNEVARDGGPALDAQLRQFDATRVRTFLRDMTGAFSRLQDVLSDRGYHNASPTELMRIMQAVTQGGMNNLGPAGMESLVGRMASMAQTTGRPIEDIIRFQANARQFTEPLGLAGDAAARAGLGGFGAAHAYGQVYGLTGAFTPAQAAAFHTQRFAQAEASSASMQVAATMRAIDTYGAGNSEYLRNFQAAVLAGQTEFVDPATGRRTSLFNENEQGWAERLARETGAPLDVVQSLRSSTSLLRRTAGRYDIDGVVYQMQPGTARRTLQDMVGADTRRLLAGSGLDADAASEALVGSLFEAGGDLNQAVNLTAGRLGGNLTAPQRRALLHAGTSAMAQVDWMARRDNLTAEQFLQGYDPRVERSRRGTQRLAGFRNLLARSLGGMGRSQFMGRLLDEIRNAGPDTNLTAATARLLNLVPRGQVRDRMQGAVTRIEQLRQRYAEAEQSGNSGQIAQIAQQLEADVHELLGAEPDNLDATSMGALRAAEGGNESGLAAGGLLGGPIGLASAAGLSALQRRRTTGDLSHPAADRDRNDRGPQKIRITSGDLVLTDKGTAVLAGEGDMVADRT